ncbi:MAG: ABC transporter ATP-binding protein [Betaproteobacteria bacterium]
MSETVLEIRNLTVDLPEGADRRHAVAAVNLELHRNEILCLVGESGSGKSVTSRAVMGLLAHGVRASAGEILFRGEDLLRATPQRMRELRGSRISMIFQEPMTALNPLKRVGDQVDEAIVVHTQMARAERIDRIVELFEAVQLPEPRRLLRSYPHQLSGGQRQRAMIAMALALEPEVLIADEPTTALDVTTQAQILALIKRIQSQRHMGVLFVTHDFGVVSEIADRVAVMQSGTIVETGTASQVLGAPRHPYTRALIAAIPSLVPRQRNRSTDSQPLLSAIGLEKSYRSGGSLVGGKDHRVVHAAKGVDLTVHRGETLGLVGESGSGKSTVARCIARLTEADGGRILLDGVDLRPLSRRQLRPYRRRIQMVFQDPYGSLNPRRTIGQLIAEGPMVHGMGEREARAKASRLLELVGIDPRAVSRYPHEFSGGQRQRIGIARALALDPEVLVADEPVSALDVSIQAQVLKLLADIRDRLHLTMLFITHDLRVAAQVCDTIAVMRYGEIVEHGTTSEVFRHPQHPYTRELLAAVPGKELGIAVPMQGGDVQGSA